MTTERLLQLPDDDEAFQKLWRAMKSGGKKIEYQGGYMELFGKSVVMTDMARDIYYNSAGDSITGEEIEKVTRYL